MKERHFRGEVQLENVIDIIPHLPCKNRRLQRILYPSTVSPPTILNLPNPLLALALLLLDIRRSLGPFGE